MFTARQPTPETLSESAARARIESFHHGLLSDALDDDGGGGSAAPERVVYHYTRSLHGFAARLTQREKNKLAGNQRFYTNVITHTRSKLNSS